MQPCLEENAWLPLMESSDRSLEKSFCASVCVCVCVNESEKKKRKSAGAHSSGQFSAALFLHAATNAIPNIWVQQNYLFDGWPRVNRKRGKKEREKKTDDNEMRGRSTCRQNDIPKRHGQTGVDIISLGEMGHGVWKRLTDPALLFPKPSWPSSIHFGSLVPCFLQGPATRSNKTNR